MSKPSMLNLCGIVRNAFNLAGYSTVKAVNAVNGYLASEDNKMASEAEKSAGGKISGRKTPMLKTKLTITRNFEADCTRPEALLCDFNARIAEVEVIHPTFTITIPPLICIWLDKFAKAEKKETEVKA